VCSASLRPKERAHLSNLARGSERIENERVQQRYADTRVISLIENIRAQGERKKETIVINSAIVVGVGVDLVGGSEYPRFN